MTVIVYISGQLDTTELGELPWVVAPVSILSFALLYAMFLISVGLHYKCTDALLLLRQIDQSAALETRFYIASVHAL